MAAVRTPDPTEQATDRIRTTKSTVALSVVPSSLKASGAPERRSIVDAIREAGGEIYAVTSEPHSLALNAQAHWETGFDHVGDPHQEILAACSEMSL